MSQLRRGDPNAPAGKLKVSRRVASQRVSSQIEEGEELVDAYYRSYDELDDAGESYEVWDKANQVVLKDIFEGLAPLRSYIEVGGRLTLDSEAYLSDQAVEFKERVKGCLEILQEINDQLILYEEPAAPGQRQQQSTRTRAVQTTNEVFVVHGRDECWKQEIARFLENGRAKPIILHEQASSGRTVIEKLERYAQVPFAVVILTADDVGGPKGAKEQQARARQNVIFELGYFLGRNERQRVCALYEEGVEMPSDYAGVVYVPLDPSGGWKLALARELKAAGVEFDLARATGA